MRRFRSSLAVAAALSVGLSAAAASAGGACVYVTIKRGHETVVCEEVKHEKVCERRGVAGDPVFHDGKQCSDVDYMAKLPPIKPPLVTDAHEPHPAKAKVHRGWKKERTD